MPVASGPLTGTPLLVSGAQGAQFVAERLLPEVLRLRPSGLRQVAEGLPASATVVLARTDGTMLDGSGADGTRETDAGGQVVGADRQPTQGVWWWLSQPALGAELVCAKPQHVVSGALPDLLLAGALPPAAGELYRDAEGHHFAVVSMGGTGAALAGSLSP